jgi:hypothetical protein
VGPLNESSSHRKIMATVTESSKVHGSHCGVVKSS